VFSDARVIEIRQEMAVAFLIWIKICARLPLSGVGMQGSILDRD